MHLGLHLGAGQAGAGIRLPFPLAAQRAVGGALALVLAVRPRGALDGLVAPGMTLLRLGLIQVSGFTILQTSALVKAGSARALVLIFT